MQASRNSFSVLKERLRPTTSEQQSSFFDVEVNLKVPCVVVSPSLDEIQEAVNTCAKKVLLFPCSCAHTCLEQTLAYLLSVFCTVKCQKYRSKILPTISFLLDRFIIAPCSLASRILWLAAGALRDKGVNAMGHRQVHRIVLGYAVS